VINDWRPLWWYRVQTTWGELVVLALADEDDFWTPGPEVESPGETGTKDPDIVRNRPTRGR
jgi:hypothetical protein